MENTDKRTEIHNTRIGNPYLKRVLGAIFGIIEIVLVFRLIFESFGANVSNGFVHGIYYITQPFVGLFEGIFSRVATSVNNEAAFEPATLIAITIVGLLAWLVFTLINSGVRTSVSTSEVSEHSDQLK